MRFAVVMRVAVLLVTLRRKACSCNTGAYCRARAKLPEQVIRPLTIELADGCEKQLDEACLWRGLHVSLVDGATLSMPDTPENQAAYPQQPPQPKGLGFPIARAIKIGLGMDIARCKTPEMVRKEMWTCLLAYNLIRRMLLQSATATGHSPRQLSFKAAMQSLAAGWLVMVLSDDRVAAAVIAAAATNCAGHLVGRRPGRIEPRAIE